MLKLKDDVDLKELERFDIKPVYVLENTETGKTSIAYYESKKYCCRHGYLRFKKQNKYFYKILKITNRIIHNYVPGPTYSFEDNNYINVDLLYDLIKADLVEKVGDK